MIFPVVFSLDGVVNEFTRATNDPDVDSVEGIMYSKYGKLKTIFIFNFQYLNLLKKKIGTKVSS